MIEKNVKTSGKWLLLLLLFVVIHLFFLNNKVWASEANDSTTDLQQEKSLDNFFLQIDSMCGFPIGSMEDEIEKQLDKENIFYEKITDNIEGNEFACLSLPNEENDNVVQEDAYFFYNGILEMCMFKMDETICSYDDVFIFCAEKFNTLLAETSVEKYGKCTLCESESGNLVFVSEYSGIICFSRNTEFIKNSGMGSDIYSRYGIQLSEYMN